MSEALEALIAAVLASGKYAQLAPDFVRAVAIDQLRRHPKHKDALKATKNKLHQVAAAYFDGKFAYGRWLAELAEMPPAERRAACRAIMGQHASTRERLPILDELFALLTAKLPPIRNVLDIACGLNPLCALWLPDLVRYDAYDLYHDLADFLNGFFRLIGVQGTAYAQDVLGNPPTQYADLALLMKALPCLAQFDGAAAERLLDSLNADHLVVTFPAHSLGGRAKGMVENYSARFEALMAVRGWQTERLLFASEVAFIVTRSHGAA
ncbi:MAG: 16S rRNA methyltransferase [Chloroflexi bacterium CFX4]|nr:16S rRNA methyltransferase [Chloroflexi bacterium CFX4]MDL1921024.1 16S rRNA methyltransferase [Chloroflexi bacterium CFX3]